MPNNTPKVSILIVAYNPWEYLRNTVRSCIDQTYENTEILILDNASDEDISLYIPECKKIRLIKNTENVGPYNWLNILLSEAKWDYIAIQDHDDIWNPEKIEKQVQFLEKNHQYIGCGTSTVMYYEWDARYFIYSLWKENFYTIHPSLLFRYDGTFRYDTSETEYMCDAWNLKNTLCHGEKGIANLDQDLTLHIIKKWSTNYSYKWYTFRWENIKRAYTLHNFGYATMTLGWEVMRKFLYPILHFLRLGNMISPIERLPFRILWNTVHNVQWTEWWLPLVMGRESLI